MFYTDLDVSSWKGIIYFREDFQISSAINDLSNYGIRFSWNSNSITWLDKPNDYGSDTANITFTNGCYIQIEIS